MIRQDSAALVRLVAPPCLPAVQDFGDGLWSLHGWFRSMVHSRGRRSEPCLFFLVFRSQKRKMLLVPRPSRRYFTNQSSPRPLPYDQPCPSTSTRRHVSLM